MNERNLLFIGAGSMAEAILKGITDRQVVSGNQITVCNRGNLERLQSLEQSYSVLTCTVGEDRYLESVLKADVIVLAMKPKDAGEALLHLKPLLQQNQAFRKNTGPLMISVIAGLSIQTIHSLAGDDLPVVRTMPNTSSTIGLGATGISFGANVSDAERQFTRQMFAATGIEVVVEESLLDVVTGISGSGPAYVYYMMEAMIQAGEKLGLTRDVATLLTVQTVIGAGEMVKQTGEWPSHLRQKVTSPNGTTQAALETLAARGFQDAVQAAVGRATERAAELGTMITEMVNK